MMEGIEILSQEVCNEFNIRACFACVILFMIIGMAFDFCKDLSDGVVGALLGIILGIFIYAIIFEAIMPEKYIKYNVTISESVSMTEFNDRYEIIDVYGKIYTIREREDENK